MSNSSKAPLLTRESVHEAHALIRDRVHLTPVVLSTTLSNLASTPQRADAPHGEGIDSSNPATPKINLFFKCENYQRVGAFKIRGAFHALARLSDEELNHGVVTHSSGNHAQALALAARTRGIKAYVVMPTISTPSKIAATKGYGAEITFSGSTEEERVAVVKEVMKETGAVLIPPVDHPNIILGQGTMGLEFEMQVDELVEHQPELSVHWRGRTDDSPTPTVNGDRARRRRGLDVIIAPCGGGGMLSGIATAMSGTGILVFGAEPSFQGADDARRGLAAGERISRVNTLTIADGLCTPVGVTPWSVISDPNKVRAIYAVSEEQIKEAMRLAIERLKVFIEPSAAVGLAVVLYNEEFRRLVEREAGDEGWNMGVVLSGGNTTLEAVASLFAGEEKGQQREEGVVGLDGRRQAENVSE